MSKIFIDTNILVFALDNYDKQKKQKSKQILTDVISKQIAVISTQVLQELYVAGTTKLSIDPILMKNIVHAFENVEVVIIDTDLIKEAIDTSVLNKVSFWDSLIVVAAEKAKCESLYTEDFNHGQIIRGVRVENPYMS
ncbi:MAG: PIN domain-containing protein [Spirochaetota bacterium]